MSASTPENLERDIERRYTQRDRRKKPTMKVSGQSVKKLSQLIGRTASRPTKRWPRTFLLDVITALSPLHLIFLHILPIKDAREKGGGVDNSIIFC